MLSRTTGRMAILLLTATLFLTACKTSEERAQDHYESGMELLEQGDVPRALLEFRNVFKLDAQHHEARLAYARVQLERGAYSEAYSQYLRVAEQTPDNLEARIELAEMAINDQLWEEAERHGRAAADIDPQNTRVRIITIALGYAQAFRDENPVAAAEWAAKARDLLVETPESQIARRVVIDQYLSSQNVEAALAAIDVGLTYHPDNLGLYSTKLQILGSQQDMKSVGDTLETMVQRFPDNEEVRRLLIAFYLEQDDLDSAEAFLRNLANAPEAGQSEKLTVVTFLRVVRGLESARAELESLVASEEDTTAYQTLLASLDFQAGEQDKAIADLEALIAADDGMTEDQIKAKIVLARMLEETGNTVGARARVEEVLEVEALNVEALKMRASWLIDEDKPEAAILDLRAAVNEAPRDAGIMTLMARAHLRAGSRDLAGERYALAVEVSNQAPAESLRYAEFLVQENRADAAKAVLTEALNREPDNIDLLRAQAVVQLETEDWNNVTRTVWRLRGLETERATALADSLEADLMLRQNRVEDTIAYLEELVEGEGSSSEAALAALVQTKVRAGQVEESVALVERRLAEEPDNRMLQFLRAGLHMIKDERSAAADIYRVLLEETPGQSRILRMLNAIMIAEGEGEAAAAMVDEQIEVALNPTPALLLKAGRLEREKDFEGAIAIYEQIYEKNSNNLAVANNLASLITTHRDNAEDLERAYAIARRLRNIDNPALQDTYGWIEHRRGNYEVALEYLKPAAEGIPEDALVQFHLGMTYHALKRTEDARAVLTRVVELAGDEQLPQFERAREVLKELENTPSE